LSSSSHRPFMNIWLDLAAAAARDRQPHRRVAAAIADGYLAWVTERLEPEADVASFRSASLFLAIIEGMYLLDAIGRPALVQDARTQLTNKLCGSSRAADSVNARVTKPRRVKAGAERG
jgi:hypothetical protein